MKVLLWSQRNLIDLVRDTEWSIVLAHHDGENSPHQSQLPGDTDIFAGSNDLHTKEHFNNIIWDGGKSWSYLACIHSQNKRLKCVTYRYSRSELRDQDGRVSTCGEGNDSFGVRNSGNLEHPDAYH